MAFAKEMVFQRAGNVAGVSGKVSGDGLGVSLENGTELVVRAAIPPDWPGYRLALRPWGGAGCYEIEVRNLSDEASCVSGARMDGHEIEPVGGLARIPVLLGGCGSGRT